MLSDLPEGLVKYSTSPEFSQDTVPKALQSNHKTKVGVWARAVVLEGSIEYIVEGLAETPIAIKAGNFAIIEPEILHHVKVIGRVIFYLEFYRRAKDEEYRTQRLNKIRTKLKTVIR